MIPLELYNQLQEVPEVWVKHVADSVGGDNNFKRLLVHGQIFQKAGLKPIYLTNQEQTAFVVSCKETSNSQKLH